jgi:hypothetical protein
MCGSARRSDLTPGAIRRKLTCNTGTGLVVRSSGGELIEVCARRLRLWEVEALATA